MTESAQWGRFREKRTRDKLNLSTCANSITHKNRSMKMVNNLKQIVKQCEEAVEDLKQKKQKKQKKRKKNSE